MADAASAALIASKAVVKVSSRALVGNQNSHAKSLLVFTKADGLCLDEDKQTLIDRLIVSTGAPPQQAWQLVIVQ